MSFFRLRNYAKNAFRVLRIYGTYAITRLVYGIHFTVKCVTWLPPRCHRFVREFEPWGILFVFAGLVVTLMGFIIELEDRQSERIFRAWEVVLSATAPSSSVGESVRVSPRFGSATRQALQFLNREFRGNGCFIGIRELSEYLTGNQFRRCIFPRKRRESLRFINVSNTNLSDIELPGADLVGGDLSSVFLERSNLKGANLYRAILKGANLREVELSGACMAQTDLGNVYAFGADFSGADLSKSNMEKMNLFNANLTSVNLSGVRNLKQSQLDVACAWKDYPPINLSKDLKWNYNPCVKSEDAPGAPRTTTELCAENQRNFGHYDRILREWRGS